ncbi:hypothetical protein HYH03_016563 [Edaphochlamys debaryana]|uniref:Arginine decarboxylase n=1 Tax=Edaphochlamys debaryana TaxID=47281 RepID=A0A835XR79_9CHLO|nr:hypothetical protein HYH03_016563 [Edaphochlamys debaryana]|eukprot:KAG2484609.1 hypothetical protein HYH03_016563 [Edaphochlamys debaryana]
MATTHTSRACRHTATNYVPQPSARRGLRLWPTHPAFPATIPCSGASTGSAVLRLPPLAAIATSGPAADSAVGGEGAAAAGDRQRATPLVDAVRERGDAVHEAPFHVPGHKRGAGAPPALQPLLCPARGSVLAYDLTEIAGLDYLSSPSGPIAEAQHLAAEAFGADVTWFLVNGCSGGIHAAVVAVCGEHQPHHPHRQEQEGAAGEGGGAGGGAGPRGQPPVLVVARNCHMSAYSAMVVAGCEPHWLVPELDPRAGVAHCVSPRAVAAALERLAAAGRRVAGVLVVSPTYFGAVADIEGIASACHAHDVPLLVDEAHGGHFAFLPAQPHPPPNLTFSAPASTRSTSAGPSQGLASATAPASDAGAGAGAGARARGALPLPRSALSCGADVVMQSTHKVLGAMGQAAMLHLKGTRVSPARISRALQTLQSSSPSYLLLASLDAARAQATAGGAFNEACRAAQVIRAAVATCRRVRLLDERTAGALASVAVLDPLRLVLLVEGLGLARGGFEAAEWLEARHGVVPELATAKTVVLALGPGSTLAHAEAAAAGIQALDRLAPDAAPSSPSQAQAAAASTAAVEADVVLTPREAFFAATVRVPADEAVGRVSAELLCPYPPGVPAVFPGERLSAGALALLRATLAAGGAVTGAQDGTLQTLEVVRETS